MSDSTSKVVVISGGTDGMGRATALARLSRGDTVVAIGSSETKARALTAEAAGLPGRLRFIRADLSSVAENRRVIAAIAAEHDVVDALGLFANRPHRRRELTPDGFERTFALYYLSRYLLGEGLRPLLEKAARPVIVNVSAPGTTAGGVNWDDLRLDKGYSIVKAMVQCARANDLLGVGFGERHGGTVPYVLYHPGFTKSGDLSPMPAPARLAIRVLARFAARPVAEVVRPIVRWIDEPPTRAVSAIDRGKDVDPSLPTLDPANARRLMEVTERLLR